MRKVILLIGIMILAKSTLAQKYTPSIEPCPCLMKVDARLKAICGYLVVPENRKKPNGNKVKVPFLFARRPDQDSAKNIVLYTSGGPGYATIPAGDSLRYNSDRFSFGGLILFDQRGTKNAVPCLDCEGIDDAIRNSYRFNQSKDSLVAIAVTNCRKKFEKQRIDLSSYNTIESAADIADLKKMLKIDSLTLLGISYSGGLMLTVARNHPEGIKSLLLNSPLPSYVNYEEHALFNHNEALNALFDMVESDTALNIQFPNLRKRFKEYFTTTISGKQFSLQYQEKEGQAPYTIRYSKNELLDAIFELLNNRWYKTVPEIIHDLINGDHEKHVRKVLRAKFAGNSSVSFGMRLSVYCSEQIAYSDIQRVKEQDNVLPWIAGYPFNSPNHQLCDCWKVKPEPPYIKTPVYSTIPALISAGALDPWTRPFYNQLIRRTMPNAQLLLVKDKAHVAGFGNVLNSFMSDPYKKVISTTENIVVE
jgi:pimeloyl-ACP methyl ester carboxylesterase